MIDSIMANEFTTNIHTADLLICFVLVTGSICWYITDTEASWNRKYSTALHNAGRKEPSWLEQTTISPAAILPILSWMSPNCAIILGTRTTTSPTMIRTDRVEAVLRTTFVPNIATRKINAATTRVQSQYGMFRS